MAKEWANGFYNSKAWKECRKSYIAKVFGICEHCSGAGYICDHKVELTPENINDPEITLNHSNLQYLCTPCHNTKTFEKYGVTREGTYFNEDGELVQATPPYQRAGCG